MLISLDTQQLKTQNFPRIEGFIVDLNCIPKTDKEDEASHKIINFIRESSQQV